MLTINNTTEGYLKDVEIKGNTWQDSENLADIRSVGTKVEGQELYEIPVLSCGKNLFDGKLEYGTFDWNTGAVDSGTYMFRSKNFIPVNSSTPLCIKSSNNKADVQFVFEYDKDKKYIKNTVVYESITVSDKTKYIKFRSQTKGTNGYTLPSNLNDLKIQIEEGTQATPYEPYQGDKLTILSPTPLEKVGDVADRIICKDGVYGVEKNVTKITLNGGESWDYDGFSKGYYTFLPNLIPDATVAITNKYLGVTAISGIGQCHLGGSTGNKNGNLIINYDDGVIGTTAFREYVTLNNITVKYPTSKIQFIPLPHDQQVKLRTFANKTNIHFETEIEPTIKAQVPKSLGATVNTHTTQIDNLNKELDRVKKLEESTVSTVTTYSSFTTIAETSGGYFEDVKVEGKTLVNLVKGGGVEKSIGISGGTLSKYNYLTSLKNNTLYTVILNIDAPDEDLRNLNVSLNDGMKGYINKCINGINYITLTTDETAHNSFWVYFETGSEIVGTPKLSNVVVLEGDHTDKDLNFFEGLKSVGQDADEISVLSVNENLFDGELIPNNINIGNMGTNNICSKNFIPVVSGVKYTLMSDSDYNFELYFYDKNLNGVKSLDLSIYYDYKNPIFTVPQGYEYIRFRTWSGENNTNIKVWLSNKGKCDYIEPKQDKKQILYYNPNTQTWEKPILREWDSIEKHEDGKYYYHKRSGEVVLNGSEDWENENKPLETTDLYSLANGIPNAQYESKIVINIADFTEENYVNYDKVGFYRFGATDYANNAVIRILKSDNIQQWLQANPVTVVYQLAKEEVYECTNLDLITYQNETNLIVNSGVLSPKITLKVHSNIGNVVNLLQKKVSMLENDLSSYIITQNRLQLSSTYAADSVTFKVDYASAFDNRSVDGYNPDLYNLILSNILVGKDNYDYDKMFSIILDYASWDQISWEQFDELVLLMDLQHNPPIEIPEEDYTEEEIPEI